MIACSFCKPVVKTTGQGSGFIWNSYNALPICILSFCYNPSNPCMEIDGEGLTDGWLTRSPPTCWRMDPLMLNMGWIKG